MKKKADIPRERQVGDPLDDLLVLSDDQPIRQSGPSEIVVDLGDVSASVIAASLDQQKERDLLPGEQGIFRDALEGLRTGDLRPIARYLRSRYPLHPTAARQLADCMDGDGAFYKLTKYRAGPLSRDAAERKRIEIVRIGRFIEERRPGRGYLDRAKEAAAKEFGYSFDAIDKKWDAYKRFKREGRVQARQWVGKAGSAGIKAIRSKVVEP